MKINLILVMLALGFAACNGIPDSDIPTSKIEMMTKLGEIDDTSAVKADTIQNTQNH